MNLDIKTKFYNQNNLSNEGRLVEIISDIHKQSVDDLLTLISRYEKYPPSMAAQQAERSSFSPDSTISFVHGYEKSSHQAGGHTLYSILLKVYRNNNYHRYGLDDDLFVVLFGIEDDGNINIVDIQNVFTITCNAEPNAFKYAAASLMSPGANPLKFLVYQPHHISRKYDDGFNSYDMSDTAQTVQSQIDKRLYVDTITGYPTIVIRTFFSKSYIKDNLLPYILHSLKINHDTLTKIVVELVDLATDFGFSLNDHSSMTYFELSNKDSIIELMHLTPKIKNNPRSHLINYIPSFF